MCSNTFDKDSNIFPTFGTVGREPERSLVTNETLSLLDVLLNSFESRPDSARDCRSRAGLSEESLESRLPSRSFRLKLRTVVCACEYGSRECR